MSRSLPVIQAERETAPPPFERVGVVGLGLIGGSVALAVRQRWPGCLVIGVDRNDVLERAMRRHATDVAADDLGMLAEADLVVLAAPVGQIIGLIAGLAEAVGGEAVVTDVGSTKRAIVEAARGLPPRLTFVGGHPLAGAARSGIEFASADLFAGRPWFLTPAGDGQAAVLERLSSFVTGLGAVPRVTDAATHDRLLASLSHLPQLAASALMRAVGAACGEDGLALAGRGLADTTRLASSPAEVWADICATNADELGAALDRFVADLERLRGSLCDHEAVMRLFEEAAAWQALVPRD